MCFAPQRRALFRHLKFRKWSGTFYFLHFWLGNVLRATTACTFSISQSPKVVQTWCALYILTWKCASRHNGVHFFNISTSISPNVRCFVHFDLETRFAPQRRALFRHLNFQNWSENGAFCTFSEPTFRPPKAPNHWKNIVKRDFPTFSYTCIFFLLSLSLLWSSHFFSSPPGLFSPLLFHLSILSEVWLQNFLRLFVVGNGLKP